MNPKQTIPAIAKIAPPLLMGVVIFMAIKSLFSDDDTEKKPETTPANTEPENRRKEAETTPTNHTFRQISAEIPAKPAVIPPVFVPPVPKVSAPVPAPQKIAAQIPPLPIKKKFVTREDLAIIFHRGARGLTRTAAVAALKNLGFGKTAAYDALSEDGRFSAWLRFAPNGKITWKTLA